jgi:hypothetical protein
MASRLPKESALLHPVITLFEEPGYSTLLEARLSRKRIDILFIPNTHGRWIAVELKVRDWKTALWQAAVNVQIADASYVALWTTSIPHALGRQELFKSYGVGIISVAECGASVVLEAEYLPNSTRIRQQKHVLEEIAAANKKEGHLDALSVLPA